MLGAGVDVHRHIGMRGGDRLHLVEGDAVVELAEVEHRRHLRLAVDHAEHLAAVVADRRGDRQFACRDPGEAAAEAVADHGHRSGLGDVVDRSGDVEHRRVECDLHRQLDAPLAPSSS